MLGHSPVNGKSWPDFYGMMPVLPPPQQVQGTRVGLPFPIVPLKSSPATTLPYQSPPSRRKPRSSSFFNPIRLAFPPRHPFFLAVRPRTAFGARLPQHPSFLPSPTENRQVPNWHNRPAQHRSTRVDAGVTVNPYDPHGTGSSLVKFSRPLQRRSLLMEPIQDPIYIFPYLNTHVPTLGHTTVYFPQKHCCMT